MNNLIEAATNLNQEYIKAVKAGDGLNPVEACCGLNDASRQVIERMESEHGEAWLVKVNSKNVIVKAVTIGDGWNLYNFCADAVVPNYSSALEDMVKQGEIDDALDLVDQMGGITLIWS